MPGLKKAVLVLMFFIKIVDTSVVLDSVYFRGKGTKLRVKLNNPSIYIGRFTSNTNNSNNNLIKAPIIPFKLKDNECIVSCLEGKKVYYYKISNIMEHETINDPSTSTNRQ